MVNSLGMQVDTMKTSKVNFNELFSSLQKNLSLLQNEKMNNSPMNETTVEGIRVINEPISDATNKFSAAMASSGHLGLLIDQMLHKIDELNWEIKKQKLEIENISMGRNTDSEVKSETLSASHNALSSLEILLLMVISVVLILFAVLVMIHIKSLIKSNIQRAQKSARRISRMSSSNTIATFDNSSV